MNVTREGIRELLERGNTGEYSHMIVFSNNYDYEYFTRYVSYDQNINSVIRNEQSLGSPGVYTVKEIYNYNLDLDEQINERRAHHIEPIISKPQKKDKEKNNALEFAKRKHTGQTRKNGDSYINHPIKVHDLVSQFEELKNIETLKQVALLHDVLEDTDTKKEEITKLFGDDVEKLVSELTNIKPLMHLMGKTEYLSHKILMMSDDALIIKLCDRLDNVNDLESADEEFREKYIDETIAIINNLLENRELTSNHLKIIKEIILSLAKYNTKNHENNYQLVKMMHNIFTK